MNERKKENKEKSIALFWQKFVRQNLFCGLRFLVSTISLKGDHVWSDLEIYTSPWSASEM